MQLHVGESKSKCNSAQVAQDQPLMTAGLDSLAAVELRNSLQAGFSIDLPATVTFDYPTVEALSMFIAKQLADVAHQRSVGIAQAKGAQSVPLGEIAAQLQGLATEILGSGVAPDQPLMEAGLDSLGKSSVWGGSSVPAGKQLCVRFHECGRAISPSQPPFVH